MDYYKLSHITKASEHTKRARISDSARPEIADDVEFIAPSTITDDAEGKPTVDECLELIQSGGFNYECWGTEFSLWNGEFWEGPNFYDENPASGLYVTLDLCQLDEDDIATLSGDSGEDLDIDLELLYSGSWSYEADESSLNIYDNEYGFNLYFDNFTREMIEKSLKRSRYINPRVTDSAKDEEPEIVTFLNKKCHDVKEVKNHKGDLSYEACLEKGVDYRKFIAKMTKKFPNAKVRQVGNNNIRVSFPA